VLENKERDEEGVCNVELSAILDEFANIF